MKVNNFYGAETYIGGFSGYLVELLVIHYKGFKNFIETAADWNCGYIIDIENTNKFTSEQQFPLIVIDPVQPNRNVAAALTKEKFDMFIKLCKEFNKKPSVKFFKEKKIDHKKYDLIFKVEPLKGSKDVVGTKMLKVFEKIKKELIENEFSVKDSTWEWKDYGFFYFKVNRKKLDTTIKHYGPPIQLKEDAEKFKIKYKNLKIKEEKNKLYVMLPRKFPKINDLIKSLLNDKEIKNRVYSMIQIK